jgi:hypothetical protein
MLRTAAFPAGSSKRPVSGTSGSNSAEDCATAERLQPGYRELWLLPGHNRLPIFATGPYKAGSSAARLR